MVLAAQGIRRARFAPDGTAVLLLEERGQLRRHSVSTGESTVLVDLGGDDPEFVPLADGLLVADASGALRRYRVGDGLTTLWETDGLRTGSRPILAVDLERGMVAAAAPEYAIDLLRLDDGALMRRLEGHFGGVVQLRFAPNGDLLSAGEDTTIRRWNTELGDESLRVFATNELDVRGTINDVLWSEGSGLLLSAGMDGQAHLWDAENGSLAGTLAGHGVSVTSLATLGRGQYFVTGAADGRLRIWNARQRGPTTLGGHSGRVIVRGFPTNGTVLTMGHDNSARFWRLQTGEEFLRIQPPLERYGYAEGRISRDGSRLAIMTRENQLRVYQIPTGQLLASTPFPPEGGDPDDAAISPDGRTAAVSGQQGLVVLLDPDSKATWRLEDTVDSPVMAIEFTPDSRSLAVGYHNGLVRLFEARTGARLRDFTGHAQWAEKIAFSANGHLMATASFDTTARVWNTGTGECLHLFSGHGSWLTDVSFAPGDERIVTSSADGTIRIWETSSGTELLRLNRGGSIVDSAQVSPDGLWLVVSFRGRETEALPIAATDADSSHAKIGFPQADPIHSSLSSPSHPLTGRLRHLEARLADAATELFDQLAAELLVQVPELEALLPAEDPEVRRRILNAGWEVARQGHTEQKARLEQAAIHETFGAHISPPLTAYRGTMRDEASGRRLRILLVAPNLSNQRAAFINGSRPEIGNWTPNVARMAKLGPASPELTIWGFDLPFRPMDFKFTLGERGMGWAGTHEWAGPPNRTIDYDTPLWVDRSGTLFYLAWFGAETWSPEWRPSPPATGD
jgi:WD40 repeat protein